ncbi:MAG TPA: 30S ribosomal protein S7 [Syntrophorhabdaceae bacterium]|nr:30S ribosomal protein S7 [Syntrophorhabdaceae bacterium]HPU30935.1 30S ribosomal protein S7 [Syntrophorhabdaceae bacterium]
MPRKGHIAKREIIPDTKYNDLIVARLINCIMWDGKKSIARKIVYGAFDIIEKRQKEDPLKIFHKAIDNIKPELEVKPRRVGGATYQVPVEVRPNRKLSLSIRWLIRYARERSERTMMEKLAGEIMDAFNNKGGAVKKREDTHKMAEANKAFAHYRW